MCLRALLFLAAAASAHRADAIKDNTEYLDNAHGKAPLVPPPPALVPPPPGRVPPPPPIPLAPPPLPVVKPIKPRGGGGAMDMMAAIKAAQGGGLKKTDYMEQAENKDVVSLAPNEIKDAEFINIPPIDTIPEAFGPKFADGNTKLLLIDFFAFSCTNCIRAGKVIADVYDRFKDKGLGVIAFARPEFAFEGDAEQVKAWIKRNDVKYPVVTDVKDTNWHSWGVDSWPTHFLVQEDKRSGHKGEYIIAHTHVGDRNSHELYNEIMDLLKLDEPRMPPMNSKGFTDVEIFMGDIFRSKNVGDSDCNKAKACKLEDPADVDVSKAGGVPLPEFGKIIEYGAGYCRYCRKAKAMLGLAGVAFTYVDVMEYGGGAAVSALLKQKKLLPESHNTLPIIFGPDKGCLSDAWCEETGKSTRWGKKKDKCCADKQCHRNCAKNGGPLRVLEDVKFIGGFTELRAMYPEITDDAIDKATPPAPVPLAIEYKKMKSTATIEIPKPADWQGGKEALVAASEGAALSFSANLAYTETASLYVVVLPPAGSDTTVTSFTSGLQKTIRWAGRHYFHSYDSDTPSDTLYFSKGTKVYVFWLSAEPPGNTSLDN